MSWIINFFKSLLGICETKSLNPELWSVEDGKAVVKLSEMPELCEKGKGVYLKGQGLPRSILILRTENDQYLAYTNRCTHVGHRKLDPVPGPEPDKPVLRCCSISHSTFDCEGNRLTGPARDPVARHEVERRDGDLAITVAVPVTEEAEVPLEAAEKAAG
jgi:cytochrome b6-f complex iron-sulfur subunit